ncbi:hypothetical protein R3P38DRAFT_2840445 [Favolaschia claudopus]|uniref:BZIP domain-containing protein n=1 Tax=Favolaschia claudopus TaxID=2862362 RepID=A0AAW0DWD9_9AGAR
MQAAADIQPQPQQPVQRQARKRKTPPTNPDPNPSPVQHPMAHPIATIPPAAIPQQYSQFTTDFSPAGLPAQPPPDPQQQQPSQSPPPSGGRTLSSSKRAEQNRKAQRAFRERRDQHLKNLESRSQLLDAALSSADEANRRWEECRVLVDQLRVENAALRATLQQAQLLPPVPLATRPPTTVAPHITHLEETETANVPADIKNHSPETAQDQ